MVQAQEKIGKFILELRKQKGMTQKELAEKVGVSDKTISKWECGNGFPDATLMLPLCNALGITANELLSGKRLKTDKEYKVDAEKNIVALITKNYGDLDKYLKEIIIQLITFQSYKDLKLVFLLQENTIGTS